MLTTLKQQFQIWLFRPKIESGTVTLTQRRIFILPTRRSVGFAGVLLLLLLGDINYSLSLGYALTFLLAGMAMLNMVHAFRNMAQLEIRAGRVDPVFAGEMAQFTFHFHNNSSLPRYRLNLKDDRGHIVVFDVPAGQHIEVKLLLPAERRGWLHTGKLTLFTEFPLGLFHAWSYLHFDTCCLVYPRPAAPLPLPASLAQDGTGSLSTLGDEDFSGLRNYIAGDSLQRIAWKSLAREQGFHVKEFSAQEGRELWLDWSLLQAMDIEHKLEILVRWVLDADVQKLHYGLRLPGIELPPHHGVAHRADCLRELALFGLGEERA